MDNGTGEQEKALYTKSEKKAINASICLFLTLSAMSLFWMPVLNNSKIVHVGAGWLYGAFAEELIAVGAAAAYIVLFVKRLRHIELCKKHSTVLLVTVLIITAGTSFFAVGCAADIFGGAREITTNEYKIYDDTEFHFADGEKSTYVFIPKDIGAEIAEVPLVSDKYSEAVSENCLYIHTESVYIKYYPHSKILAEVRKAN